MRYLNLFRAFKEGGNKRNPGVKRNRRGTTFEGNIRGGASRAAREDQDHPTLLQNGDRSFDRT